MIFNMVCPYTTNIDGYGISYYTKSRHVCESLLRLCLLYPTQINAYLSYSGGPWAILLVGQLEIKPFNLLCNSYLLTPGAFFVVHVSITFELKSLYIIKYIFTMNWKHFQRKQRFDSLKLLKLLMLILCFH